MAANFVLITSNWLVSGASDQERRGFTVGHYGWPELSSHMPPLPRVVRFLPVCIALTGLFVARPVAAQTPMQKGRTGLDLTTILAKWTGDLDGMQERRTIRVLTAYNRTLYFIDRGTERGTAADQGRLLETELNKTMAEGHLKLSVVFVPVSRDELLPALMDGRGDLVM